MKKFLKKSEPKSPVEFALDRADDYQDMVRCKCTACTEKLSQMKPVVAALARTLLRVRREVPALCFVAMVEGWEVRTLIDRVNEAVKPDTEECDR